MKSTFYKEYPCFERYHWWFSGRNQILDKLFSKYLPRHRSQSILDVGSGSGDASRFLDRYGSVVSVERAREAFDALQKTNGCLRVRGDALHLPFQDESFSVITALDVIEHLEEDADAVSEFWRACQKRGYLCVTVPAFMFLWGKQDVVSVHKRRYTLRRLKTLLEQGGFSVVKISYFNFFLFPPIAVIRMLNRPFLRFAKGETLRSDFTMTSPGLLNNFLAKLFGLESFWLQRGRFPFGVSIVCLAKKI